MKYNIITILLVTLFFCVLGTPQLHSQVMQGGQYQINIDSINFGGKRSTSTNFIFEDTLGEISSGFSSSTNYNLYAGYQQMNTVYLSATLMNDVTMTPDILGISGGESNGTSTVTVITDNMAGYEITIKASTTPALKSPSDSFDDYIPGGLVPDYDFSYGSSESVFSFSIDSDDVANDFKDNGSDTCGTGSNNTYGKCWDGLSTTTKTVVDSTTNNQPAGTLTNIVFKAGSGGDAFLIEGTYQADIIVTILPN